MLRVSVGLAQARPNNFVKPSSVVRKLLPQRVCAGRETWPYYRAPHGECHKGVYGRRFVATEKSAAQLPTLTKKMAPCFCAFTDGECEIPDTL